MVLNQPPGRRRNPFRYYDFAAVRDRVHRYFGPDVDWAPISSQVRDQVRQVAPDAQLAAEDWHEIIDVAHWWRDRDGFVGDLPVIGRHGRADPVKWPRDPDEILAAYPETTDLRVRVLGGGEIAVKRLGHQPANWDVVRFGAEQPEEFLRTIDFFVYFHDPEWVEAFGRTILEAMASGVPVIIGEHFRPTFGDAALYTTPAGGAGAGPRALRRPRALPCGGRAGPASSPSAATATSRTSPASPSWASGRGSRRPRRAPAHPTPVAARRVLLVSDNGAGMGHLSRLMAIARRLPADTAAVIATQSYAASVAHQEGFLTEYIPSRKALDSARPRWIRLLRDRLDHLIELHEPAVVAVDSVPHPGIVEAVRDHPEITWVWVRRAMWQRGVGTEWITEGKVFDRGARAGRVRRRRRRRARPSPTGRTPTRSARSPSSTRASCWTPPTARAELGLDDRPAALLQLGAGNINDIASPVARICRHLTAHGFQLGAGRVDHRHRADAAGRPAPRWSRSIRSAATCGPSTSR